MQKRQFLATAASLTALSSTPWLTGCASRKSAAVKPADAIYFGGPILTMNDAQPQVEAVAVTAGLITATGALQELEPLRGPVTRMVDLQGRTLLPGFVDPHSHIGGVGLQAIAANLLPPPDAGNASIADLQQTLREYIKVSPEVKQLGIVLGFGYDDSQLKERRHPTRDDLDAVSRDLPIALIHQSGHFGALNSAALARAGIGAGTSNPEGGVIRRRAGSQQPNGVLEENAFFHTLGKIMPKLTLEQSMDWLEKAQKHNIEIIDGPRLWPMVKPMVEGKLQRRIDTLLGFDRLHGEMLQGQRYTQGQEFKPHTDWFPQLSPGWARERDNGGQRAFTAMVFLNTVHDGGETDFPHLDLAIPPRQGMLLVWNNARTDGMVNDMTIHAARPVEKGVKYVITKWYRTRPWG